MNNVCIIGNLTRDVELRVNQSGKSISRFSIAYNRRTKESKPDDTSFFDIVCFDKLAELVNQYCHKGSKVAIIGSLKQSRFKDKEGNNRQKVEIIANEVEFLNTKNKESQDTKQEKQNNTDIDFPADSIIDNESEVPF